jgi:glycosyltransferase involved in cell wall biosynthesis
MDRAVVDALLRLPEHSRFMKGLFAWVGFKQVGVPYDRPERPAGKSQWSFPSLFKFALDGIFSFSTVPLRVWTWLGTITATLALIYALVLTVRTVVYGVDVPGYASLMVALLFFGGVQLISTGVLGEYIGRITTQTKARPLYIVNKTVGFDDDDCDGPGENDSSTPGP